MTKCVLYPRCPSPVKQPVPPVAGARNRHVIQVFSREHPALTLSRGRAADGITRATARRILLTLEKLGHVRSDGRRFSLTPRVLTLGWAYLSSLNLWETRPAVDGGARGDQRILLGGHSRSARHRLRRPRADAPDHDDRPGRRHAATRALDVDGPGPARRAGRATSSRPSRRPHGSTATPQTIVDPGGSAPMATVRGQGWALVDQELEIGLRSVAAPITASTAARSQRSTSPRRLRACRWSNCAGASCPSCSRPST